MVTKYKWTIRCLILSIIFLTISVFLMGGGHGTYKPAMFFFPFGLFPLIWQDRINSIMVFVSIVQFPLYGLTIDYFRTKDKGTLAIYLLVTIHTILFLIILKYKIVSWR